MAKEYYSEIDYGGSLWKIFDGEPTVSRPNHCPGGPREYTGNFDGSPVRFLLCAGDQKPLAIGNSQAEADSLAQRMKDKSIQCMSQFINGRL